MEEDNLLLKIMIEQQFTTWIAVAEQIPGRTARQCRDRWTNYLSPQNKNGPWTAEEDQLLIEKFRQHGPQWTLIAKFFNGRSENNVKNRWYTHLKQKYSQQNDQIVHSSIYTPQPESRYILQPVSFSVQPQHPQLPPISSIDLSVSPIRPTFIQPPFLSIRLKSVSAQPFIIYH